MSTPKSGWFGTHSASAATFAVARESLKHLSCFESSLIETMRVGDVDDYVAAVAARTPRTAELMLDTLKMILRSARERGQVVDEAILRLSPPRRE